MPISMIVDYIIIYSLCVFLQEVWWSVFIGISLNSSQEVVFTINRVLENRS